MLVQVSFTYDKQNFAFMKIEMSLGESCRQSCNFKHFPLFIFSMKTFFKFMFLYFGAFLYAQSTTLLLEIDQAIQDDKIYLSRKNAEISRLRSSLKNLSSKEDEYMANRNLALAYFVYKADSAKYFSQQALNTAERQGNVNRINESIILNASIEAKEGMFPVAFEMLKRIDREKLTKPQLIEYYKTLSEVYIYWIEYQQGSNVNAIVEDRNRIRDSLISMVPENSYEHTINLATKNIEEKNFGLAESILLRDLNSVPHHSREYSIYTSILAYLYQEKGDREKQKEYLAKSALSDIQSSIKENLSLRSLATLLYEEGDIDRANSYIKKSLEDANFFNARLRNLQISRILPIIDKAYTVEKERQQTRLKILLVVVSLLSAVLLAAVYLIVKQVRKISKAGKDLQEVNIKLNMLNENLSLANENEHQMNLQLTEANHIKEQYIHSFLEICTEYINRLSVLKEIVHRKLKNGQTQEVLKMTSSTQDTAKELKELYSNFDRAFLNIYPNFVKELNQLLREEERYPIKESKTLNQELRVYALIRLGVTDNNRIATFLHYSLRTVYNYRSKVKSKAKNRDDSFETKVQEIGLAALHADFG